MSPEMRRSMLRAMSFFLRGSLAPRLGGPGELREDYIPVDGNARAKNGCNSLPGGTGCVILPGETRGPWQGVAPDVWKFPPAAVQLSGPEKALVPLAPVCQKHLRQEAE